MGWSFYDAKTDECFDLYKQLAAHLDNRDVAVLFEVGFEGSRYIRGFARAIHPDGRIVYMDLVEIYERARLAFGQEVNISVDSATAAYILKDRDPPIGS
jgi:hypothetical protein